MASGKVIAREPSGKNVYAVASDVNHLFMRLLPEATELIYAPVDGALRRLPRMLGWGRAKLPLLPVIEEKAEEELAEEDADGAGEPPAPGQPRNSTPDAAFRRVVRRKLLLPLASVADQYLAAMQSSAGMFPDADLAQ